MGGLLPAGLPGVGLAVGCWFRCPSGLWSAFGGALVAGLSGFCGSRSLSSRFAGLVSSVVAAVPGPLAVGCAAGADRLVRAAGGSRVRVFRASSFAVSGAPWSAAWVARSVAFVRALAGSPAPLLVAFVSGPCPAGLVPSSSPSRCFRGLGSGSWASLALAVGLGVPVAVFSLPASPGAVVWGLPLSWGSWSAAGALGRLGGLSLAPRGGVQLSLFS